MSDKQQMLDLLAKEVSECRECKILSSKRKKTVFGRGSPDAYVVFIGEAPGANEDEQGLPFVGRAGDLLNNIISACKFPEDSWYIMNVIKCRPPENRTPDIGEVQRCSKFFELQLRVLDPLYIVCLGAVAGQRLFGSQFSIGVLRGCMRPYHEWGLHAQVLCTYHPAYLLRNPEAKKAVWDDMQMLLRVMRSDAERIS